MPGLQPAPMPATGGLGAAPSLRPFMPGEKRPNADGSYSTELSTTWQLPDGSWANVPSLWMGPNGPIELSKESQIMYAMQNYEAATGQMFPRFKSEQEAVGVAQARSHAGGVDRGALAKARK